jgi:predicted DNA-binding WGR domain protein|tara:strand:- start:287 stop:496 length:210 start_codon:yes stop_codon:yes gene_type:complete
MKKYFEFKNEVSNKFWEISQKGILVKVVFGRIGIQNPQEQIKEFINEQEAKKFADKKIREKINKGYIQH